MSDVHEEHGLPESVREITCSQCSRRVDVSGLPLFTEFPCPHCGADLVVSGRVGPFLVTDLLGKGGMGAVYRGRDESLNRAVAIKVLLPALGQDQEFVETFRREAQAAAALNHPNIVQIYSFGVEQGQPYMVMELLDGGRFDQMMAKGEPLKEGLVLRIGADVAEGLKAANDIGLVHGDVKPENILLDANGVAKVVDFGLARFKERDASVGGIWGTPYYIAPEKVRRQPSDARADIYSLGATLYHAMAAKPPFDGETPLAVVKARLARPAPPLRSVRPEVHLEVEGIIARMIEAEPGRRYPTYVSLLADMRKVLPLLQPSAAPTIHTGRRAGRIVLTKPRAAGKVLAPAVGSAAAVPGGALGAPFASEAAKPKRRKPAWLRALVAAGVLAILGVLGAGSWWLYSTHRAAQARQEAAGHEARELAETRRAAGAALSLIQLTVSNALARAAFVQDLVPKATNAAALAGGLAVTLIDSNACAEALSNAAALAQRVVDQVAVVVEAVPALQAVAAEAASNHAALLALTNAAAARAQLGGVTGLVPRADAADAAAAAARPEASKAYDALLALRETLRRDQEAQAEEVKRLAAERAAAAQRAAEEAAAKKAAEEHAARLKAELETIDSTLKSNLAMVRLNQFQEAAALLQAAGKDVTTEEGRQALDAALERYRLLVELKTFLAASIATEGKANANGFRYGWLVNNVPSLDVLGADEVNIQLRGRSATWSDVNPAQMARFIRHYVPQRDAAPKARARQWLMAAVYFYEAGRGSEPALALAAENVAEAVRQSGDAASQAQRLMPDLPEGKSE